MLRCPTSSSLTLFTTRSSQFCRVSVGGRLSFSARAAPTDPGSAYSITGGTQARQRSGELDDGTSATESLTATGPTKYPSNG